MDITKKHNTEIYKDEQHGRYHQKHSTEIYKDEEHGHHQKTTQKYIKMSNMDITKKHYTEIYKDRNI